MHRPYTWQYRVDIWIILYATFLTFNFDGDYFEGQGRSECLICYWLNSDGTREMESTEYLSWKSFDIVEIVLDGHLWISILKLFQPERRTLLKFITIENDLKEDLFLFDKLIEWIWVFPILYRYSNSII